MSERTIRDVFEGLSDEEKEWVYYLAGLIVENPNEDPPDEAKNFIKYLTYDEKRVVNYILLKIRQNHAEVAQ